MKCDICGFEKSGHEYRVLTAEDVKPIFTTNESKVLVCKYCFSKLRPSQFHDLSETPCIECGSRLAVNLHHIDYLENKTMPLCAKCHRAKHKGQPRIRFIERPILLANGDWAVGTYGSQTFLYSRYPRDGGQLTFKYPKHISYFGKGTHGWAGFIGYAGAFLSNEAPEYEPEIIAELNQLRLKLV